MTRCTSLDPVMQIWSTSCFGFSQLHVSTSRSYPRARWVLCFKLHFWNFGELEALNFPQSHVFVFLPGPSSSCGRHGVMDHQQTNTGMWMRWSPVYVEESPEAISTWSINFCSVMITANLPWEEFDRILYCQLVVSLLSRLPGWPPFGIATVIF